MSFLHLVTLHAPPLRQRVRRLVDVFPRAQFGKSGTLVSEEIVLAGKTHRQSIQPEAIARNASNLSLVPVAPLPYRGIACTAMFV